MILLSAPEDRDTRGPRPAVIDQDLGWPRATRPDGPLPDRDYQADDAGDHQDQANRPQIQALDMEVGGEAQDRADRDQEDAACKRSSSPPLKDAAEKIDGEQDQDNDDENSDDGQDELLGWVSVSWAVKMGGDGPMATTTRTVDIYVSSHWAHPAPATGPRCF